jgi:hypothetical protein
MNKNRLNEISAYLQNIKNEPGIAQLRNAPDKQLTDFGKFTKWCYELCDALVTPNEKS